MVFLPSLQLHWNRAGIVQCIGVPPGFICSIPQTLQPLHCRRLERAVLRGIYVLLVNRCFEPRAFDGKYALQGQGLN